MKKSVLIVCLGALAAGAVQAQMYGLLDDGNLYSVNMTNGDLTVIGQTNRSSMAGLELSPSGALYYITTVANGNEFGTLDKTTGVATAIGNVFPAEFLFEGALAFSPSGVCYATNVGAASDARLVKINTATGVAETVGTMNVAGAPVDINGLAWRSDGVLVGMNRVSSSLVTINPLTGAITGSLPGSENMGATGGMTSADGKTGYFVTGNDAASNPGSCSLYSVDLFTGQKKLIRDYQNNLPGTGFRGLAIAPVPEPMTMVGMGLGFAALARRRRVASR